MSSPDGVQTWNINVSFAWTNVTYYFFLKLFFFFCNDGNGPGRAQLEMGRAGLGLIFLERQRAGPGLSWTGRAEKNGPVQASSI